ncbi:hypothetical protein [Taibaiella sp. KBW10]|uniref:hypothetical protein n=1 Tax=Taibaiella sp. KBW10 TaxID=2153357 RepID=UPI000F59AD4D|nr:hypothetical protein [Taibaiella sp. KBW10]
MKTAKISFYIAIIGLVAAFAASMTKLSYPELYRSDIFLLGLIPVCVAAILMIIAVQKDKMANKALWYLGALFFPSIAPIFYYLTNKSRSRI